MTTMLEQLELMREKMRQMSESELQLVRGLGEALNVADDRLREQVRQFAAEHNQRRTTALVLEAIDVREVPHVVAGERTPAMKSRSPRPPDPRPGRCPGDFDASTATLLLLLLGADALDRRGRGDAAIARHHDLAGVVAAHPDAAGILAAGLLGEAGAGRGLAHRQRE